MKLSFALVLCGLLSLASQVRAQDADFWMDTESENRVARPGPTPESNVGERARVAVPPPPAAATGWNALPLVSYAPETQFAFGAFGVTYFRVGDSAPTSRPSYLAADAIYTTRMQAMVDIFPELYFGDERFAVRGQLSYRRMPDYFYGIGNQNPKSAEESYTLHSYWHFFEFRVRTWDRLFVGLREEFQIHEILDPSLTGQLANNEVVGAEGGIRSGLGLLLNYDSRDSSLAPHKGGYYQAMANTFQSWLGSDWTYTRLNVDLRQYVPIGDKNTIAFQVYGDFNFGNVPFHQMATLGGAVRLRGYYEGRFRDRNCINTQIEWRMMPVVWRFGLTAFVAAGQAFDEFSRITFDGIHWTVGGGIRYQLNKEERVHIRLDFGASLDTWGIYFNVLEAF